MNLLGISWGMGARDVGMKAAVDSAQKGVSSLNDSLERQSKIASKSKIPGFFEGLKQFNLGSIAQSVRDMAGDTGNLTNSLEAMGAANAKTAKPFVAAMNLSADAARKMTGRISGMAIGMNVGAESVAKVFTEFNRMTPAAKETAKALGMTEKDFVKFSETTGVSAADLNSSITDLTGSWNMAPESVAKFLNSMTELGKKTGVGMTPIAGLKDNLQSLDDIFEKMPPGLQRTGAEITGLVESSVRLAGAFAAQGASAEDATKMGAETAKMFAEQSTEVERMMKTGMGKGDIAEASPLIKYLTGLGIGFEEARGIVDVGSRDTVQGVQRMQAAFTKYNVSGAQQQAMLSGLSEAMGEGVKGLGYLAAGGDSAAASLKAMSDITVTGKDTLKKYGDQAFSSGRTLQDSLDLMKSSFETRLRSIARKDVSNFVGDLGRAYKQVGDETIALAGDKNWGPIVKRLSAMQQLGAKGLFIRMDGKPNKEMARTSAMIDAVGGAFDSVAKSMGPVVSIFSELVIVAGPLLKVFGKILKSPLGKLGMWGIALAGVAMAFDWLSKSGTKLSTVLAKVTKWVGGAVGGVADFLGNIDWESLGKKLGGFVMDVLTAVPKMIMAWATGAETNSELGNAAGELIGNLVRGLWNAVKGLATAVKEMGTVVIDQATKWWDSWTWDDVAPAFEKMEKKIVSWWGGLQENADMQQFKLDASQWFRDAYNQFRDGARELVLKLWGAGGIIETVVNALNTDGLAEGMGNKIRDFVQKGAIRVAGSVQEIMHKFSSDAFDSLVNIDFPETKWATITAEYILKLQGLATGAKNSFVGFVKGLFNPEESIKNMSEYFPKLLDAAWEMMKGFAFKISEYALKAGAFAGDVADQIFNPEVHRERMAKLAAEDLVNQKKILEDRVAQQVADLKEQKTILDAAKAKYALQIEGSLSGIGVAAEGKTDKQIAKEQVWKSKVWGRSASEITDAAKKYGEAQAKLQGMEGMAPKNALEQANLTEARNQLSDAQKAMDAAKARGLNMAKQSGVSGAGLEGIGQAMDILRQQQADTAKYEALALAQEQRLAEAQTKVQAFTQANAATITDALGQAALGAGDAGIAVVDDFARGINNPEANKLLQDSVFGAADMVSQSMTTHSPILAGPLMDVGKSGESDPAWMAGRTLMESMALGIESGTTVVAEAVARALDESVLLTFDAYHAKMEELAKKKSLLTDVANMMMRDFGKEGSIVNTITVDDKTEDVRANMKAMLSVPGLAGVTMAIINESAKQRAILDKIRGFTQTIAESQLVTNTGAPTAAPVL
jgi:hypothetical protein